MSWELILAGLGLFVTIVVNIVLIAYFAGQLKASQSNQEKMIEIMQKSFKEQIKSVQENHEKTVQTLRTEIREHFDRLERKQDKHNCVIERQYRLEGNVELLEEKIDVANHRITDLENGKE
jgi:uncharacterized membrane protein YgaE (UPF0421/DUF939 family)